MHETRCLPLPPTQLCAHSLSFHLPFLFLLLSRVPRSIPTGRARGGGAWRDGRLPGGELPGGATVRLRRAPRGEKRHGTTGSPSRRSGRGGTGDGDALPRASSPVVAANSAEVCVCFLFFLIFPHFFLQNLLFFFLRIS
jgi:hypothetical protein